MSRLSELQRRFQRGVLGEGDGVLTDIASNGAGASPRRRLAVYADAVRLRFLEVLRTDFPGVHALLGDPDFETLAGSYLTDCPSNNPSIRWYGSRLAKHLAGPAWRERPEVSEMAEFEWRKGELHDAADSPVMDISEMASVPAHAWADLRPQPVPALRRLELHWNVPGVWVAMDAGEPLPALERSPAPQSWILWRHDLRVRWRSMDAHEAWALDACSAGLRFGEICDGLADQVGEEEAPMRAAGALKQWLGDGLIAAM